MNRLSTLVLQSLLRDKVIDRGASFLKNKEENNNRTTLNLLHLADVTMMKRLLTAVQFNLPLVLKGLFDKFRNFM